LKAIRRRVTLGVLALRDTELLGGENVERNSGNSMAPHLHFHVMGGQPSLASDRLPYVVGSLRSPAELPALTRSHFQSPRS
jgi:diadenosine tetraphosphate (Ap4A) HIT family hydrolase